MVEMFRGSFLEDTKFEPNLSPNLMMSETDSGKTVLE